jgi:hypothetical protein
MLRVTTREAQEGTLDNRAREGDEILRFAQDDNEGKLRMTMRDAQDDSRLTSRMQLRSP